MSVITYKNTDVKLHNGESVLDGLLRSGFDVPCGCKAGKCQTCLISVQRTSDPLQPAQKGVCETQKSLGYVLSCQFKPQSDTQIQTVQENGKRINAKVIEKSFLNDQVIRLRLKVSFDYKAGQYITLYKDEQTARSYSIASHNVYHDFIEIHIRIMRKGIVSQWIKNDVWVGHEIGVQGPMGDCCYKRQVDAPLIMCATGTGIAPIYGILQDAIINGHKNEIHIVYASKRYKDFYLIEQLQLLSKKYPHIHLHLVTQLSAGVGACKEDVYEFLSKKFKNLDGWQGYICGVDTYIKKIKKVLFLNGLNLADTFTESFLSFEINKSESRHVK